MIKLFEKFKYASEIKDIIFLKAVKTDEKYIIDLFLDKGYDINTENAILYTNDEIFRYFLEKGANIYDLKNNRSLNEEDVQKALIDFNHEDFIYDNKVNFNYKLKQDPEYGEIIKLYLTMKESGDYDFEKYKDEKEMQINMRKYNIR